MNEFNNKNDKFVKRLGKIIDKLNTKRTVVKLFNKAVETINELVNTKKNQVKYHSS